MGRYILSIMDFGGSRRESRRGSTLSGSLAEWAFYEERPDLSNTDNGMCSFAPPLSFSDYEAVTLGDARGRLLLQSEEDHNEIVCDLGPRVSVELAALLSLGMPSKFFSV